jgi:tetratricopeptide (TPR) repeat protein
VSTPDCATAWQAGFAHFERWETGGQTADRDAAIAYLEDALADPPEGLNLDLHLALAGLHSARAGDPASGAESGADVSAAIRHARSGLADLRDEPVCASGAAQGGSEAMRVGTELRLLLGFALAEQFSEEQGRVYPGHAEGVSSARRKRNEAIGVLTAVASELPAADPASGAVADALGQMLHDRYADPWPGASPDPVDLDRAVGLLLSAVDAAPEPLTISYLTEALADRYHLRHDAADLDRLIVWCQRLLDSGDPPDGADTYQHELLGLALMERAAANPQTRVADLDAAIRCLETALAALPPGHPGRASLVTSAAQACWQRLDGDDSRYGLVDQMTSYAEEAWAASPPGDQDRIELGLYVAIGIHERLRRPDAPFDIEAVSRAIEILTEIEPLLADTPSPQLTVMVLCGHFLVARGQVTGTLADLNAAQPLLLRAAAEIDINDPNSSELTQTLAAAMGILAQLGMAIDHLDHAISLLSAASSAPEPAPARAAMTRGTLGALLVQRAGFTASWDDLDEGIAHILASYEITPGGHAYRIAAAMNLTAALLIRFLERGQAEDVDAARYYLTMADTLAGPTGDDVRTLMADTDVVIASNRGLLGIADSQLGDPSALDKTVVSLRAALSRLPPGHPYDGRIRSDLGLALATRAASAAGQPADLEEAARELSTAVAALSSTHMMRPLALLRAASTLTAAAAAAGDQRLLRQAIGHLSTSLAELDPRFGGRFRFVAILGAAALTLHRHSNAPGDLDEAIRWLEQARRDLDSRSYHPQYANCLFQLALAYRSRGHAESAHQAGLAALRGRARDLLLQSGTARAIGFARLAAAEATQVAAWCFADGRTAAAVEALELGRGLILHASTCVTGVADLLAAAGHEKLAREWRDAAADPSESPWDAAIPGSAHLPGLLSGAAGLGMPDDLRARALSALAGSSAELSLLAPPSPADLAMALAETGADALIYLLGPGDGTPGRAVIVPAPGLSAAPEPTELLLPWLSRPGDDVFDGYVSAYTAVLECYRIASDGQDPGDCDDAAAERLAVADWRCALGDVCDWAWRTAMEPVLNVTRTWRLGRPARVVLIPAEAMSLVPWHAARYRPADHGPYRYVLEDMVVSYAASGRQLREVSGRGALPLSSSPVVVGDPTGTLPGALREAQAIVGCHYPGAHYLGAGSPGWDRSIDGPGTPGEVLAHLPAAYRSGASVLHLGCHGVVASSAPGRSHLVLAGYQALRVDAILQQAHGRPPIAPGGLVSLAACTSDLAAAEYDEALTPATAFLAAGAATVVGARWQLRDSATTLLMFMFHYFMTRCAYSPRDALRAAQQWMLNPARAAPQEMPPALAEHVRARRLADVDAWAGFVHQGR